MAQTTATVEGALDGTINVEYDSGTGYELGYRNGFVRVSRNGGKKMAVPIDDFMQFAEENNIYSDGDEE